MEHKFLCFSRRYQLHSILKEKVLTSNCYHINYAEWTFSWKWNFSINFWHGKCESTKKWHLQPSLLKSSFTWPSFFCDSWVKVTSEHLLLTALWLFELFEGLTLSTQNVYDVKSYVLTCTVSVPKVFFCKQLSLVVNK